MSSSEPPVKMEVDNPAISSLKRSSSAPMINEMNAGGPTTATSRELLPVVRPRRFSTSFSPIGGPSSPKLTPRVNQLRREESVDPLGREAAHEKELHSAMVISQSWEDLTLVQSDSKSCSSEGCPPRSPSSLRSSPSFLQASSVFRPAPLSSPSPTRKFATRRSQSPIAMMRPSPLGSVKRKFELDQPEPSAKRGGLAFLAQPKLDLEGLGMGAGSIVGCCSNDQPMGEAGKAGD